MAQVSLQFNLLGRFVEFYLSAQNRHVVRIRHLIDSLTINISLYVSWLKALFLLWYEVRGTRYEVKDRNSERSTGCKGQIGPSPGARFSSPRNQSRGRRSEPRARRCGRALSPPVFSINPGGKPVASPSGCLASMFEAATEPSNPATPLSGTPPNDGFRRTLPAKAPIGEISPSAEAPGRAAKPVPHRWPLDCPCRGCRSALPHPVVGRQMRVEHDRNRRRSSHNTLSPRSPWLLLTRTKPTRGAHAPWDRLRWHIR